MSDLMNEASKVLGKNIMIERKQRKLSQYELADGICSQSMISSIEKGNYVPNSILLAQICNKLGISLNNAMLSDYFQLGPFQKVSKKIERLCNEHKYDELIDFMDNSNILNNLYSNEDFQKYYYYYGCGIYQLTKKTQPALRFLNMALKYTYNRNKKNYSSIEVLLISAINLIKAKTSQYENTNNEDFEMAINIVKENKYIDYNENLNIIFYQYALILYHEKKYKYAIKILTSGINWITNNNSTFMISDLYFLLSNCYSKIYDFKNKNESSTNAKVLSKVFNQFINKDL